MKETMKEDDEKCKQKTLKSDKTKQITREEIEEAKKTAKPSVILKCACTVACSAGMPGIKNKRLRQRTSVCLSSLMMAVVLCCRLSKLNDLSAI